jgi:hypothetical protein
MCCTRCGQSTARAAADCYADKAAPTPGEGRTEPETDRHDLIGIYHDGYRACHQVGAHFEYGLRAVHNDGRAQGRAEALREAEAELIRMGYTEMDEAVKRIATLERTVKP